MQTFDFSPLFRSGIGFDRLAHMLDATYANKTENSGYPPYNIAVTGENDYRITLAVAGFTENDLEIEVAQRKLSISGKKEKETDEREYLYRGIAERDFSVQFQLAEYVEVTGASLNNGILIVDLSRRVPDALKPRSIKIENGSPKRLAEKTKSFIEGKAEKKAA